MSENAVEGPGVQDVSLDELRRRARQGDASALQALRDRGFFAARTAASGFPLSHAQQRLWLVTQMVSEPGVYNLPHAFQVDGRLDIVALRRAFGDLTARHESLRTTFAEAGGGPRQFVHEPRVFALDVVDLTTSSNRELAAREAIARDARVAFDLTTGPLMRATLFTLLAERHILSVNLHHIVCDGWSLDVIARELAALYAGAPLPPLAFQYRDYAAEEGRRLRQSTAAHDYWHGKLAGELTPLALADRPRPAVQTSAGATFRGDIDAGQAAALERLGRSEGATAFMTLVALVKVLLYRHTGQADVIVGTPIAGRERPELEHQIGMFANTLALRDMVDGRQGFRSVLRSVRQTALKAYEHQHYPFDRLVSELGLERDVSQSPLFNVMVSVEHAGTESLVLGDARVTPLEIDDRLAKFDLTFFFSTSAAGLAVAINYNVDLFRPERIAAMAGHLRQLIEGVVTASDTAVAHLPMLAPGERDALLAWGGHRSEYERGRLLDEWFEDQARATPDAVASVCGDARLTYAEVSAAADSLARRLRTEFDLRPEECVGVLLDRSQWVPVAWLGVLKAGGAYVPLSPTDPIARIEHILRDTRARTVISESQHLAGVRALEGVRVIDVRESGNPAFRRVQGDAPCEDETVGLVPLDPDRGPVRGTLAYVIYTSGSTGVPKGVLVEHDAVVRLVRHTNYVRLGATDRILQTGSLAFDASTFEIWGALLNGGAVCFAPETSLIDSVQLALLIARHGITTMWLTSSLFNELADQDARLFRRLRQLLIGGETLSPRHVTLVREACPSLRMINGYGPTENTTFTTCFEIEERFETDVPIGRPIANTTVALLDDHGEVVPAGVAGEICAGGDGLARGYVGDPVLTARRFVPDPHGRGTRVYRTGDLGRWLPGGDVEYIGRLDTQVKIRGHRIEPGEIEHVLLRHPSVSQCAVTVRPFSGEQQLVAYVVPHDAVCDETALRDHVRGSLAGYMVPAHIVVLEKLPLGRAGKVDHRSLPEPMRPTMAARDSRSWTGTETELSEIWRALLDVDGVGLHDNFFALGGHSLKAVQLVARIHAVLHVRIGLIDVFRAPTIAALAPLVEAAHPFGATAIPLVPVAPDYPVSHAQRRLWVLERMGALTSAYNIAGAFEIRGVVDVSALERAVAALVERHESLRTTFTVAGGEPRQVIQPFDAGRTWLRVEDRAEDAIDRDGVRFDLERGPLFQSTLARYRDRCVLRLEMHHVISDGWSVEVLLRELVELYASQTEGRPSRLPALRVQYKDYAAWQNEYLRSPQVLVHREYWHHVLAGPLPVLDLPADRTRPPIQTFRGDVVLCRVPGATLAALTALGRRLGASAFMTFVALVKVLLYRYTRQTDLVVGSPVSLRDHPDLEHQIGFYVNMLPLRGRLSGRDGFADVVANVRQTVTEALEHCVYPFDRLVEELEITRDMGRNPVFDCVVTYQNAAKPGVEPRGLEVSPVGLKEGVSKFDLTFAVTEEAGGGASVAIEYSSDLFDRDRIQRMATHLLTLAGAAASNPHGRIAALDMMPAEEQRAILDGFAHLRASDTPDISIAAAFERQAAAAPDGVAVVFGESRLTYRELNDRADVVAGVLARQFALGSEECVGVLLGRSEWVPVALLGILKAGGAYVPLDKAYPPSRSAHILAQARCRLVLSEPDLMASLPAEAGDVLDVRSIACGAGAHAAAPGRSPRRGGHLAYVMFTSGSTGEPKGSLIEQRSVIRLVLNTNYVPLDAATIILQTGSLAFDASTFEIWGPLLNGGTLVFAPETALLDAGRLRDLIARHGVTTMFLTTGLFNQLTDEDPATFGGLRHLLTGGEKLSTGHMNRAREACPALAAANVYGPTENTTFSTWFPIDRRYDEDVPIGHPIANTHVLLLDENGEVVPIGVPGELCAGGDGLSRGYLADPAQTADLFVPHPLVAGARLYRTGDIARWNRHGAIEYLGRRDTQVKVRGYRIEPAEIERRLLAHDAVAKAVVIAVSVDGGKKLVAYIEASRPVPASELRPYLVAQLPSYMVPGEYVQVERFPLTRNGKVDLAALPAPGADTRQSSEADSPTTPAETALVGVWEATLGRSGVGIHENYFELGGDSIRAIQIASRLRRRGWILSIQDLFYSPTIAQLGVRLTREDAVEVSLDVSGDVPLTGAQRWFFAEQDEDLHHFNQAVLLKSGERIDPSALRAAVAALQRHHDALRMTFRFSARRVEQAIAPLSHPLDCAEIDLRGSTDERAALTQHASEAHGGFTLETGPLFKAVSYRLSDGDRLLLVVHHLVVDGVSWRVLLEDLEHAYGQALDGAAIDLGPKTMSFKQWAEDVARYVQGLACVATLPYWRDVAATQEAVAPVDSRYGEVESVAVTFSTAETRDLLTRTHHAYTTEINDLLLTALGRTFRAWTGRPSTLIMLEGHGREPLTREVDLGRTVGWFTSLYPFALTVTGDDVGVQIKDVKESLRRIPHRGLDYALLRYVASGGESLRVRPFATFNYLGQFGGDGARGAGRFTFADEGSGASASPRIRRPAELEVSGLVSGGQLVFSLSFSSRQYARAAMEDLIARFRADVLAVIDHCVHKADGEKTVSDFACTGLTSAEFDDILKGLN